MMAAGRCQIRADQQTTRHAQPAAGVFAQCQHAPAPNRPGSHKNTRPLETTLTARAAPSVGQACRCWQRPNCRTCLQSDKPGGCRKQAQKGQPQIIRVLQWRLLFVCCCTKRTHQVALQVAGGDVSWLLLACRQKHQASAQA